MHTIHTITWVGYKDGPEGPCPPVRRLPLLASEWIFLPHDAMVARYISSLCVIVYVCVSDTLQYCIKTAERRITQIMPHNSTWTRFLTPKITAKFELDHVTQFNFAGPIHILWMAEGRAVKFCTKVGYIKSCEKKEKSPPKGAWLWSRDPFHFLISLKISPERLKLNTSNFVRWFTMWCFGTGIANYPLNWCGHGHVTFVNLGQILGNNR